MYRQPPLRLWFPIPILAFGEDAGGAETTGRRGGRVEDRCLVERAVIPMADACPPDRKGKKKGNPGALISLTHGFSVRESFTFSIDSVLLPAAYASEKTALVCEIIIDQQPRPLL
ncbi:hypothetical protein B296_00040009 [Ensete ventricosum]|uniref:Uncharacterized protein n=1 Tax=Ensete ventricosum TaxID=4639 RepID=A0A426ZAV9_ENSVE|nr:hypothetical protein B296_00040009 [Ensete ventricosum]